MPHEPLLRDTRAALLAAARTELTEHGHAGISLRAVARRAGVSHAAPKYFFQDRSGLMTAIATDGFRELTRSLHRAAEQQAADVVAALGQAYIAFALDQPAVFDLMFRPFELHRDDPDLVQARADAIGALDIAVTDAGPQEISRGSPLGELTLISWAFAHGVAVLLRDGALPTAARTTSTTGVAALARGLVTRFTAILQLGASA